MGNIITNTSTSSSAPGEISGIENGSILAETIRLALSDTDSKKRACCIKMNQVYKSLPFVNNGEIDYTIVIFNSLKSEILEITKNIMQHRIEYLSDNDVNTICTFSDINYNEMTDSSGAQTKYLTPTVGYLDDDNKQTNQNSKQQPYDNYIYYTSSHPCSIYYSTYCSTTAITNQNCKLITSNPETGPYATGVHNIVNNPHGNNSVLYNIYNDCNCVNSPWANPALEYNATNPNDQLPGISPPTNMEIAYAMDPLCFAKYPNNFKQIDMPTQKICYDSINQQGDSFSGTFAIYQSLECTASKNDEVTITLPLNLLTTDFPSAYSPDTPTNDVTYPPFII